MNAQSLGFETEFLHKKIPYSVVGSLKFYQREEIKDALSFLAFLANQKDEVAFTRIVNKPARGIGNTSQEKIFSTYKENANSTLIENYTLIDACLDTLSNLPKKAKEGLSDFVKIVQDLLQMLKENSSNKNEESLTSQLAQTSLIENSKNDEEVQTIQDSFNSSKKLYLIILPVSSKPLFSFSAISLILTFKQKNSILFFSQYSLTYFSSNLAFSLNP